MHRSALGDIALDCWAAIPDHHPKVELDAFVIMPNHIHGVICIIENCHTGVYGIALKSKQGDDPLNEKQRQRKAVPATEEFSLEMPHAFSRGKGSLSAIVGSFKAAVTRRAREGAMGAVIPIWQRSYHDRIIRNDKEWNRIRSYIASNPAQWGMDRENPLAVGDEPDWPWLSE